MNSKVGLNWQDLSKLYCPEIDSTEILKCEWLRQAPVWPAHLQGPVEICDWLGALYVIQASEAHRKAFGQFFTPPLVASFIADLCAPLETGLRVIEPAAGTGCLIAALAERIALQSQCRAWHVTAYEVDSALWPALRLMLGYVRHWSSEHGIQFAFEVKGDDFILANTARLHPAPLLEPDEVETITQLVIANPPYFKIPKTDPRVAVMSELVYGQPNIYALFMAAAAKLLEVGGQLVFITPRSFCSGPYFRKFRQWFFQNVALDRIHLFESRAQAFSRDEVLQENVILAGRRSSEPGTEVVVSSSQGTADLSQMRVKTLPLTSMLDLTSPEATLSLPLEQGDSEIQNLFGQWHDRLHSFGLSISTGPIVPFRTSGLMTQSEGKAVPVIWGQHVRRMTMEWPLQDFDKPQWMRVGPNTQKLLLPNCNYVLLRRFSPKEDNSRLIAAPSLKNYFQTEMLGIENHVNYVHQPTGELSEAEALGLAAFLNSRWVERYFRLSSGNTQVSATEIRNLPLPPIEKIRQVGERLKTAGGNSHIAMLNRVVSEELNLPLDLPNENGGHMSKIEEAKDILTQLGLPPAQRKRSLTMIPVQELAEGKFQLSPGKHNQLQAAVIREFAPRFAPGARLLYFGDTAKKILWHDVRTLRRLGFPVDKHGKLPDIVLYQPRQKWLYMVEVVTSHGPVSPKRHHELEGLLAKSSVGRIYVSVFPDFREYTRHARSIAWETEIWIAEAPEHLIHYNGDKFIGPRKAQPKRGRKIKAA